MKVLIYSQLVFLYQVYDDPRAGRARAVALACGVQCNRTAQHEREDKGNTCERGKVSERVYGGEPEGEKIKHEKAENKCKLAVGRRGEETVRGKIQRKGSPDNAGVSTHTQCELNHESGVCVDLCVLVCVCVCVCVYVCVRVCACM